MRILDAYKVGFQALDPSLLKNLETPLYAIEYHGKTLKRLRVNNLNWFQPGLRFVIDILAVCQQVESLNNKNNFSDVNVMNVIDTVL